MNKRFLRFILPPILVLCAGGLSGCSSQYNQAAAVDGQLIWNILLGLLGVVALLLAVIALSRTRGIDENRQEDDAYVRRSELSEELSRLRQPMSINVQQRITEPNRGVQPGNVQPAYPASYAAPHAAPYAAPYAAPSQRPVSHAAQPMGPLAYQQMNGGISYTLRRDPQGEYLLFSDDTIRPGQPLMQPANSNYFNMRGLMALFDLQTVNGVPYGGRFQIRDVQLPARVKQDADGYILEAKGILIVQNK